MKKIIFILLFFSISNAEFYNRGFMNNRDNGADLARVANTLDRIEKLLIKQNELLTQIANKDKVQPKVEKKSGEDQTKEYMDELKSQNPALFDRKLVFPEDQNKINDEVESCIKECAEIYETTDKYELRYCLTEMCGFEWSDLY